MYQNRNRNPQQRRDPNKRLIALCRSVAAAEHIIEVMLRVYHEQVYDFVWRQSSYDRNQYLVFVHFRSSQFTRSLGLGMHAIVNSMKAQAQTAATSYAVMTHAERTE